MRTYVAVPGTWAWRERHEPDAWFQSTSAFAVAMREQGLTPLRPERPFMWTTRINGDGLWRRWLAPIIPRSWERGDTKDWESAAPALVDYCELGNGPDVIIAHSHAGQVLALAAARYGLRCPLVVTVSTPVRDDLEREYFALRRAADTWRHLYDSKADWIAVLGGAGDGHMGLTRAMPQAHENVGVRGVSHTGVLTDPKVLPKWGAEGWLS